MKDRVIITYSQSPLRAIFPFFEESFDIYDEKLTNFSSIEGKELWIDAYIDLYDEKLKNYDYLYQFFARIHKICDEVKIAQKRILRNFTYFSSFSELYKIFYLYYSFVNFFEKTCNMCPIYVPDVLGDSYNHHPYNHMLESKKILWTDTSLFRVIHINDVVTNLLSNQLEEQAVIIQGMKVNLSDIGNKITQIFGVKICDFENAYEITVDDVLTGQILTEVNYNLEALCIANLRDRD